MKKGSLTAIACNAGVVAVLLADKMVFKEAKSKLVNAAGKEITKW